MDVVTELTRHADTTDSAVSGVVAEAAPGCLGGFIEELEERCQPRADSCGDALVGEASLADVELAVARELGPQSLDTTQMQAIRHALRHRVSIVQGPPGTGKTFLAERFSWELVDDTMAMVRVEHDSSLAAVLQSEECPVEGSGLEAFLGMLHEAAEDWAQPCNAIARHILEGIERPTRADIGAIEQAVEAASGARREVQVAGRVQAHGTEGNADWQGPRVC